MKTVDIKIGDNAYLGVSTINVDKINGGTANFVYEGITFPVRIQNYFTTYSLTSNIKNKTKFDTSVSL